MSFYLLNLTTLFGIFVMLGISYNLLLGYTGLLSISHAAFFGLGAYTAGILMRDQELEIIPAAIIATAVGGAVGALVGLPARRVAGIYLVLMTLGLQYVAEELFGISDATGGKTGLIGIPSPTFFGTDLNREGLLVLVWVFCLLVTFATRSTLRSPFGRVLEGIREDELAARSLGKRTGMTKVQAFMASSALASLAGAFFAQHLRFISPSEFGLNRSIEVLAIVIIGGLGVFWGPYFGAFIVVAVPQALTFVDLPSNLAGDANTIIFSLVLLLILRFRPQGLAFSLPRRKRAAEGPAGTGPEEPEPERDRKGVVLETRNVSIAFGGLKAVQDVSLTLRPGQITGLIGPNGAGKTTLFNMISGVLEPDEGDILLDGQRLNGKSLEARVDRGVVRSFQDMKIFMGMTCQQNLMLPSTPRRDEQVFTSAILGRRHESERRERVARSLKQLGLGHAANTLAKDLSYAEQKRLMIGRLLSTDADCYLLDEPMSGLDEEGRATILALLRRLADAGATICLVEHSLTVIESVCTDVAFLMDGKLVKVGPAQEILRDPELVELYFGSEAIAHDDEVRQQGGRPAATGIPDPR